MYVETSLACSNIHSETVTVTTPASANAGVHPSQLLVALQTIDVNREPYDDLQLLPERLEQTETSLAIRDSLNEPG